MKQRLLEFLKAENKSSAQLAEEIGVQPSGISHILSGRNNPSLDFVVKMLEKYQFLSTDWLLFGKGSMYRDKQMQTLFDENEVFDHENEPMPLINESLHKDVKYQHVIKEEIENSFPGSPKGDNLKTKKIVWFFNDNSFEEYLPGR